MATGQPENSASAAVIVALANSAVRVIRNRVMPKSLERRGLSFARCRFQDVNRGIFASAPPLRYRSLKRKTAPVVRAALQRRSIQRSVMVSATMEAAAVAAAISATADAERDRRATIAVVAGIAGIAAIVGAVVAAATIIRIGSRPGAVVAGADAYAHHHACIRRSAGHRRRGAGQQQRAQRDLREFFHLDSPCVRNLAPMITARG